MFLANLMELPFGEFDLILGMDCLIEHRANLDCASKRVILRTNENCETFIIGERRDYYSNIIFVLVVKKLVRKGYEAYLAFVSDFTFAKLSIKDIRMVLDFSDCLKKLPGVPPDKEVVFNVDLLLGTTLVLIEPYCMASKELKELNAQL